MAEKKTIPMVEVLARCREVHGDKYEYPWESNNYSGMGHEMPIICKEHGQFSQKPSHHIYREQGCTKCLKKTQTKLFEIIEEIFTGEEVFFDFKHQEMRFSSSNIPMEIDIWIPSRKLGIEYQGEFHFIEHWGNKDIENIKMSKTLQGVQSRDKEKKEACEKLGISLVEVDYTWDRRPESIRKILRDSGAL